MVVLFLLMIDPCGPIHIFVTNKGVSTAGRNVKAQNIIMEVPEYTELLSGTDKIVALGTGTVGKQNYNNSTLMIYKTHSVQIQ